MNPKHTIQPEYWTERYTKFLLSYARGKVPQNITDDLVQETYLAGLKSLKNFKYKANERTWLTSILKHKIIDYYRQCNTSKSVVKERALRQSDFEEIVGCCWGTFFGDESQADDRLRSRELEKIIFTGIAELTKTEKEVIKLKMKGYTTNEICKTLNIRENNCWVHLSRARKKLRKYLVANYWEAA